MTVKKGPFRDEYGRPREQRLTFDVVTVPQGVSPLSAPASAFTRIRVAAINANDAAMDMAVVKSGRTVAAVVLAGDVCHLEIAARVREEEKIDRVNIMPMRVPSSYEA